MAGCVPIDDIAAAPLSLRAQVARRFAAIS
jgi:hypothetical protein